MLLSLVFQLIEHLSDLLFLFGRYQPEVIEQTGYFALFAEILDSQSFGFLHGGSHTLTDFL